MSFKLSVSSLKEALGIPASNTSKDSLLGELIDEVHAQILTRICGGLTSDTPVSYTDVYDVTQGNHSDLMLSRFFVTSVTSVRVSMDGGITYTTLSSSTYTVNPTGRLARKAGAVWPIGTSAVEVVFVAGITAGSADELALRGAERFACIDRYRSLRSVGLEEETIGDYSYTKDRNRSQSNADFPPETEATLMQYTITEAWRGTVP